MSGFVLGARRPSLVDDAAARIHARDMRLAALLALAAIADPSDAGRALANSLNVPWFAESVAMLETIKPQGAVIATPNSMHIAQALQGRGTLVAEAGTGREADTVELTEREAFGVHPGGPRLQHLPGLGINDADITYYKATAHTAF